MVGHLVGNLDGSRRACFCGWGTMRDAMLAVLMMVPPPCASMCRPSSWQHLVSNRGRGRGRIRVKVG